MGANEDDASIVTAIIAMARSLRLRVIAEGVETNAEAAFLRDHGCGAAQGYRFGRPMPPSQFARCLRRGIVRVRPRGRLPEGGMRAYPRLQGTREGRYALVARVAR